MASAPLLQRLLASRLRAVGGGALLLGWIQCGGGSDTDDQRACTEIIQEAGGAVQDALLHADRTCTQDSDCILFDFSLSCLNECTSEQAAASSTTESALTAENAALAGRYCPQLARPDCEAYLSANSPSCGGPMDPLEAICWNGKCEPCRADQCLLEDEMQICTRIAGELSDCYSLEPRR